MGAVSDLDDLLLPYLSYITHKSPYTPLLAAATIVTLPITVLVVCTPVFPLQLVALIAGWTVLGAGHPAVRGRLLPLLLARTKSDKDIRCAIARAVDDDAMTDAVWSSEQRSVELWENERWADGTTSSGENTAGEAKEGWSKRNLKAGERVAWTRGRDGWSGVGEGGVRSVSVFPFTTTHMAYNDLTAAISRSRLPPGGALSRQKTGGPTCMPSGPAKTLEAILVRSFVPR